MTRIDLTTLSPTDRERVPKTPTLLLDKRCAAMAMSISERQLDRLVEADELQTIRIGRLVRFDPRDLRRWINAQKTPKPAVTASNSTASR